MEPYPKAFDLRFEEAQIAIQRQFVEEAEKYIGSPTIKYRNPNEGMDPPTGFDCSGFVTFILDSLNIPRPASVRHTDEYFSLFGDFVHPGRQRAGDLIFFSANGIYPTHVGIIRDADTYIHAPVADGDSVRIDKVVNVPIPIREEYAAKQIYIANPIGYKRIVVPSLRIKVR